MTTQNLISAIQDNNLEKVKIYASQVNVNDLDYSEFKNPRESRDFQRYKFWSPIDCSIALRREEITQFLLSVGAKIGTSKLNNLMPADNLK